MDKQTQEALKMAQEVLNLYCEQLNSTFANDALKAIDKALEQPINEFNPDWDATEEIVKENINLHQKIKALEQPAQEPVLKVVYGEICYLSKEDDQSYGMWCPVTENYKPPFNNETNFYTHPHQCRCKE